MGYCSAFPMADGRVTLGGNLRMGLNEKRDTLGKSETHTGKNPNEITF